MALQFSAPNFVQPQNYDAIGNIGQSIDGLFNRYMSGALQAQQLKMGQAQVNAAETQNAANLANFQQQNMGLTPQAFNAGMNDLNAQKSMYAKTQDAIAFNNASAPGNMVTAAPQPFSPTGDAQTVQQILLMHMAQMGMSAQQAQAALLKTQGEARMENYKASMIGAPAIDGSQPQGGGQNVLRDTAERVGKGLIAPNGVFDAVGRDPALRLGMQNQMNSLGLNEVALQNAADKSAGIAKAEGGENFQGKIRTAKSIISDANVLKDLVGKLGSSDYQLINKYGLAIAAQKGSVAAQEILDQSNLVADRFQGLIGGGSDAKLELGQHLFSAAKTDKQLARGVARMAESLDNYSRSLQGKPLEQADLPDAAAAERAGKNKPANAPAKWAGGDTHTYPDGTVARFVNGAWVRAK